MLAAFIIAAGIFAGCGSGGDAGNGLPAGSLSEEERPEAEKEKSPDDDAVVNDTIEKKQADASQKAGKSPEEKPADGKEAEAKQDTKKASPHRESGRAREPYVSKA